jgi:two-component system cell cycle response regulator CtrA
LRNKLSQATGGYHHIETVWGRGYVLRDPAIAAGKTAAGIDTEDAGAPVSN